MAAVSLFSLVESGDAQTLQEQIEAGNIDLGSRDSNGRTVLDLAVILGQEDITKILTENGEVNLVNTSGGFKACEKKKVVWLDSACMLYECFARLQSIAPGCGLGASGVPQAAGGVWRGRPPAADQARRDGTAAGTPIREHTVC